jgi:hypothetical protein
MDLRSQQASRIYDERGSYVVVRTDGQPLEPCFMRALVDYADLKARIVPERLGVTLDLKERILARVSREEWEEFYWECLEEQFMKGLEV